MNNKEDKRILKTKQLIKNTFSKLLDEKEFEKITISEIANNAMISKGTFYYHYEDKYDFVQKLIDEMIEDYKELTIKRLNKEYIKSDEYVSELLIFMNTKLFPEFSLIKKINIPGLNFRERVETLMANEIKEIIKKNTDLHINDIDTVARVISSMQITFGNQLIEKGEPLSPEKNLETIHDIINVCCNLFSPYK